MPEIPETMEPVGEGNGRNGKKRFRWELIVPMATLATVLATTWWNNAVTQVIDEQRLKEMEIRLAEIRTDIKEARDEINYLEKTLIKQAKERGEERLRQNYPKDHPEF